MLTLQAQPEHRPRCTLSVDDDFSETCVPRLHAAMTAYEERHGDEGGINWFHVMHFVTSEPGHLVKDEPCKIDALLLYLAPHMTGRYVQWAEHDGPRLSEILEDCDRFDKRICKLFQEYWADDVPSLVA